MRLSEVVAYCWLKQAFLAFIVLWFRDNELFQLITRGNIAYELCRPSGMYGLWYAKLLGPAAVQRFASLPADLAGALVSATALQARAAA